MKKRQKKVLVSNVTLTAIGQIITAMEAGRVGLWFDNTEIADSKLQRQK